MLLSGEVTTKQAVIGTVLLIVIIFIYVVIREKLNRKKAQTGEDKEALWNILERAVPDIGSYTRAYGCWEWSTYQGKRKTTEYWYYGLAFNGQRLWVVPLSCEGGDMSYSKGFCIEKADVGVVNSKKGGVWVEFYDRSCNEMLSLTVFEENLNDDRFHPVNIIQEEEAKEFLRWKDQWMEEINRANGVVASEKMKRPLKR